jgi:hypothetical protein
LRLNSYLVEGSWRLQERSFLFGRFERLDRNELFADDPVQEAAFRSAGIESFTIDALTLGYTRNFQSLRNVETGIGGDARPRRSSLRMPERAGRSARAPKAGAHFLGFPPP